MQPLPDVAMTGALDDSDCSVRVVCLNLRDYLIELEIATTVQRFVDSTVTFLRPALKLCN